MQDRLLKFLFLFFIVNLSHAQAWMTSLEIAQKLALVQNKNVLMVWEGTTKYPYPVVVDNQNGRTIIIGNLYEDESITPLIWKYFIPVIVNEDQYGELYNEIKGKRKLSYIEKFNDNSIKIMDVNGNIINVGDVNYNYQNITELITKYAFDTSFITPELTGYKNEKNFYSSYYLASKYLDLALYSNKKIRTEIIDLSNIYLNEALVLSQKENATEKVLLQQRLELLKIQEHLILKRPKKVLRQLNNMSAEKIDNTNATFVAFLYYTAYVSLKDMKRAETWKTKMTSVNLKKAQLIINLNS